MRLLFTIICCSLMLHANTQTNFNGVWQGILQIDGTKPNESRLLYCQFSGKESISGKTREEIYGSEYYAVSQLSGSSKNNNISFKQKVIESKKTSSKITWCVAEFEGVYNDSTGYIKGTFKSSTCKRHLGTFIIYRSKIAFQDKDLAPLGHAWRDVFLDDLKAGRKAPEIREQERANFKFQSIFFDHDQTIIKEEYHAYLKEMIRVVNGHSDLRILVTGHTDADGSAIYNQDLSRRRAESIRKFFSENGLDLKKLEVDFRGENEPIDNNATEAGKRLNRRVDFKFI